MADKPNDPPVGGEQVKFRMTRDEFIALERKLSPPNVTDDTSVLNAGMKLGIQVALKAFRDQFVQGL